MSNIPDSSELVSVIIVNYNGRDYLNKCLHSIKIQTYKNIELIVVDNSSTDGSVEMLRSNFPSVILIRNSRNELYAKAQNAGISASKGNYVLCLNNDTILDKNYISECVNVMQEKEDVGMVGGKILRMDKQTLDSAGQFLSRSRKPYDRGYRQKDKGQYETEEYVFGPSGAASLFRKTMLEEIKFPGTSGQYAYFDEDYGMFYEDLDLAWRANKRGWKAYYNPKAIAYHTRGGSCQKRKCVLLPITYDFILLPRHLQVHLIKNRYMTIIKNETLTGFLVNSIFIFCYDLKLFVYMLFFRPILFIYLLRNLKFLKTAYHKRKSQLYA